MTTRHTRRITPWVLSLLTLLGASSSLFAGDDPKTAAPMAARSSEKAAPEKTDAEYLAEIRAAIAGREQEPAEQVFKDIQLFKGLPADRVLRIMEKGYTPALGVHCSFCHKPGKWEESTEHRSIAREMAGMMQDLNTKLKEIAGPKAVVNCYTCHRGTGTPATNAGPPATKP